MSASNNTTTSPYNTTTINLNLAVQQIATQLQNLVTGVTIITNTSENLDGLFMLVMALIVFFMQFGWGLFEAGMLKNPKTIKRTLIKNYLCILITMISYWLFGFALSFGATNVFIGGSNYWGFNNVVPSMYPLFWANWAFAVTTVSIATSAWAERAHVLIYVVFAFVWSGWQFPFPVHWIWTANGWLQQGIYSSSFNSSMTFSTANYVDISGASVVHINGGMAALMGAIFFGRRPGRFDKASGKVLPYKPHSSVLLFTGAAMMQFGMLALNALGQWSVSGNQINPKIVTPASGVPNPPSSYMAVQAMYNTIVAGACAAGVGYIYVLTRKSYSEGIAKVLNAGLAGMVAQSASAGYMYTWAAAVTGLLSGVFYIGFRTIIQFARVDDVTDAFSVHCIGGIVGLILTGLFSTAGCSVAFGQEPLNRGLFFLWEIVGAAAVLVWSLLLSSILLLILWGVSKLYDRHRLEEEAMPGLQRAETLSTVGVISPYSAAGPGAAGIYGSYQSVGALPKAGYASHPGSVVNMPLATTPTPLGLQQNGFNGGLAAGVVAGQLNYNQNGIYYSGGVP